MITDLSRFQTLSPEELQEVEQSSNKERLFISGYADFISKHLVLFNADKKCFVVPFESFKQSGTGLEPNFEQLSIIDYGNTIKLGEYEAASDAILFDLADKFSPNDEVTVIKTNQKHKIKYKKSSPQYPNDIDSVLVNWPIATYVLDNGTYYYEYELK